MTWFRIEELLRVMQWRVQEAIRPKKNMVKGQNIGKHDLPLFGKALVETCELTPFWGHKFAPGVMFQRGSVPVDGRIYSLYPTSELDANYDAPPTSTDVIQVNIDDTSHVLVLEQLKTDEQPDKRTNTGEILYR